MKSVSKTIADRITRAKYIFIHGIDLVERGGPVKEGLAVLAFHDSLEMMLRAIAEHFHTSLKENEAFDQLIHKLEQKSGSQITHRSSLLQLNKARVGFKHHGLLPQSSDVEKFRNDLEEFYSQILHDKLGLEFWGLSLADLVTHHRAKNWLKKAEHHYANNRYSRAVECAAASLAIFGNSRKVAWGKRELESKMRNWRVRSRDEGQLHLGLMKLAREVDARIADLEGRLDWVASRVSFEELQRFLDLVPEVTLTMSGKLHFRDLHSDIPTQEESLFCITFVTETIIRQQDQYRRDPYRSFRPKSMCRVIKETPIMLILAEDEFEEIRMAQRGEELPLDPRSSTKKGFKAIFQDGETTYVDERSVDEIN